LRLPAHQPTPGGDEDRPDDQTDDQTDTDDHTDTGDTGRDGRARTPRSGTDDAVVVSLPTRSQIRS
jgi:hypothetical protein